MQPSSIQRHSQRRLTVISTLDAPDAHAQPHYLKAMVVAVTEAAVVAVSKTVVVTVTVPVVHGPGCLDEPTPHHRTQPKRPSTRRSLDWLGLSVVSDPHRHSAGPRLVWYTTRDSHHPRESNQATLLLCHCHHHQLQVLRYPLNIFTCRPSHVDRHMRGHVLPSCCVLILVLAWGCMQQGCEGIVVYQCQPLQMIQRAMHRQNGIRLLDSLLRSRSHVGP